MGRWGMFALKLLVALVVLGAFRWGIAPRRAAVLAARRPAPVADCERIGRRWIASERFAEEGYCELLEPLAPPPALKEVR
jgi:hypothetical protein